MRKSVSLIIENRSCGSLWQTPDRPIMLLTLTTGGAAGTKLVRPHFSSGNATSQQLLMKEVITRIVSVCVTSPLKTSLTVISSLFWHIWSN